MSQQQLDLFADEIPTFQSQDEKRPLSSNLLKVSKQNAQLSPAQQSFNRLLSRIDKLKSRLEEIQNLYEAHRPIYHQALTPLRQQHQALMREMVFELDRRLQHMRLSAKHKYIATSILCDLCEQLITEGSEEIQILHDKYSDQSLAQKEQAAIMEMREMMEDILGQPLDEDESLHSMDDLLNAGMARMREAAEAEQEKRKQTKARKKTSATQRKAEANRQEAETTLRKVYRQLASALHPDRENDADVRTRKTSLMSEANAAYERRDLVALLQIQLRTELTDSESIARMAEEKISSLSLLLKQQISELEQELNTRRQAALNEFGLQSHETLSITNLRRKLRMEEAFFEENLIAMQQDLQRIQDDKAFKRWLIEQNRLSDNYF